VIVGMKMNTVEQINAAVRTLPPVVCGAKSP
jgi:hypothetical protein